MSNQTNTREKGGGFVKEGESTADDGYQKTNAMSLLPQVRSDDLSTNYSYTPVEMASFSSKISDPGRKPMETVEVNSLHAESGTAWQPPLTSKIYRMWTDGWTIEVLCCAMAVMALICLCATLRYFDGHIITAIPLKININTLIAVFGALMKAAILLPVAESISELKWTWFAKSRSLMDLESFDVASRGPWGAARLVWYLRSRGIAALGAWITVLALAIDPFTQQIIRPVICHHSVPNGIAQIPRANNFTGIAAKFGAGFPLQLVPDVAAAIYGGLMNDYSRLDIQCSTGNCTFPNSPSGGSFQTLALDVSCVDISAEIVEADSDPTTMWYLRGIGNSTTVVGQGALVRTSPTSMGSPFNKYWPAERDIVLFSFASLIYIRNEECEQVVSNETSSTCPQAPLAVECRLWPTIRTITASIDLSELQEHVIDSQPLEFVPYSSYGRARSPLDSWLSIPDKVLRDGEWEPCTASLTYTPDTPVPISNYTLWFSSVEPEPSDLRWWAGDCIFWVPTGIGNAFSSFLDELYLDKVMAGAYGPSATMSTMGDVWIKRLYSNGAATVDTVETNFRQLAKSINTFMRNNNSTVDAAFEAKTIYATGSANKTETCILVQWAWLSFSASLVLLTVVFLSLTVWKTRGAHGLEVAKGVWKSSILAVLFSGLNERARRDCGAPGKKSEMIQCAEGIKVALNPTEHGWRLTRG